MNKVYGKELTQMIQTNGIRSYAKKINLQNNDNSNTREYKRKNTN